MLDVNISTAPRGRGRGAMNVEKGMNICIAVSTCMSAVRACIGYMDEWMRGGVFLNLKQGLILIEKVRV
jgi:hypothetical protein